jgi:hypothetical protein
MIEIIIIETVYLLLVALPSIFIYQRARQLYSFSRYRGIRYFASAFLFLAIGFIFRYLVMLSRLSQGITQTIKDFGVLTLAMEFFLVLPGLFLLYSMVWQRLEKDKYSNSYYQAGIYALAILLAAADTASGGFSFMYSSQIAAFVFASAIGFRRYKRKKSNFMQLYSISMVLFLIVWVINMFAQYTIDAVPIIRLYAYLFTVSACLLVFFITFRLTRGYR